jgi:hypothetical protein
MFCGLVELFAIGRYSRIHDSFYGVTGELRFRGSSDFSQIGEQSKPRHTYR